jgi:hypothetical protein
VLCWEKSKLARISWKLEFDGTPNYRYWVSYSHEHRKYRKYGSKTAFFRVVNFVRLYLDENNLFLSGSTFSICLRVMAYTNVYGASACSNWDSIPFTSSKSTEMFGECVLRVVGLYVELDDISGHLLSGKKFKKKSFDAGHFWQPLLLVVRSGMPEMSGVKRCFRPVRASTVKTELPLDWLVTSVAEGLTLCYHLLSCWMNTNKYIDNVILCLTLSFRVN